MKLSRTGAYLGLAAALLFGASTPLAKALLQQVDPGLLAGLLYLGAGIGLGALGLVRRMLVWVTNEGALTKRDVPWLAGAVLARWCYRPCFVNGRFAEVLGSEYITDAQF